MKSFEELLQKAERAHGHLCAGQVLGVRMALLGLDQLGIADPHGADRKRLVTFVEIDRCATDAIGMVTGCRLGKRTLKFRDWGKMAATFVDLALGQGVRVVALEGSRDLARQLYPQIENKSRQQMQAYRELPDAQLFRVERVQVAVDASGASRLQGGARGFWAVRGGRELWTPCPKQDPQMSAIFPQSAELQCTLSQPAPCHHPDRVRSTAVYFDKSHQPFAIRSVWVGDALAGPNRARPSEHPELAQRTSAHAPFQPSAKLLQRIPWTPQCLELAAG